MGGPGAGSSCKSLQRCICWCSVYVFLQSLCACVAAPSSRLDSTLSGSDLVKTVLQESYSQLQELSKISDASEMLVRSFQSPAHDAAARKLRDWMDLAGMHTWIDAISNVHGELCNDSNKTTIVIGSHYDTVIDAGAYDGTLGIIVGIAAVKALILSALNRSYDDLPLSKGYIDVRPLSRSSLCDQLAHNVRLVGFADEEGLRYQTTFLGSRALVGTLDVQALSVKDANGTTLHDAIVPVGRSPETLLRSLKMDRGRIESYIEMHIEQGPVLQQLNQPLGVVTSIAGQARLLITIKGEQGHAGTVPMQMRKDALVHAAKAIHALSQHCSARLAVSWVTHALRAMDRVLAARMPLWPLVLGALNGALPPAYRSTAEPPYTVCTVGQASVWPGASNTIPGSVEFTVDIRSADDGVVAAVEQWLRDAVLTDCGAHGLSCGVEQVHTATSVHSDPGLVVQMERAITAGSGISAGSVPRLSSGAGHDAMAVAQVVPMVMVFARCRDGISHSPAEFVTRDDTVAAAQALWAFLRDAVSR